MKAIRNERHQGQLLVAHLEPGWIRARVYFRLNDESLLGDSVGDQIHNYFVAPQGTAPPVLGDVSKHPVLNLVPLTRPRGEVTYVDGHLQLGGQLIQRHFPQATSASIATAAIGGDQQFRAVLYRRLPICHHQRRIAWVAKRAVS